jgi:hypothetical protein
MKKLALALMVSLIPLAAQAEEIRSTETNVNIARVVQVINLVTTPEIQVNVAVQDHGGSTDMSPTQAVYLTLYAKGEMFSTDAAFEIANVFSVKGAKRIKGGIYEITVLGWEDQQGLVDVTYVVDARKAIVDMKNVDCGGDFDCDASEKFSSTISVVRK